MKKEFKNPQFKIADQKALMLWQNTSVIATEFAIMVISMQDKMKNAENSPQFQSYVHRAMPQLDMTAKMFERMIKEQKEVAKTLYADIEIPGSEQTVIVSQAFVRWYQTLEYSERLLEYYKELAQTYLKDSE